MKANIRVLLILSRIHNYPVWSRDVKQAFVQSKENLKRDVYIRPPRNQSVLETLGAEPNSVLRAIKPLYGLPEAPTYWWCTISAYHEAELKMQHCVLDPCLFFLHAEDTTSNDGIVLEGVQAVLVDDTLGTGDSNFEQKESGVEQVFETKERSYLPFKFNGSHLELVKIDEDDWDAILQQQHAYGQTIESLSDTFTSEEFAKKRGMIAYIATSTRPDVCFHAAKLAQALSSDVSKDDKALLRDAVRLLQQPIGLLFRQLDMKTTTIVGYSDASFAGNSDHSSQLGMVIVLKDNKGRASFVHYGSWKCRRVTRSILAAEVHAFAACLDYCITLAHDLKQMLGRDLKVALMTDSKSLFDTVTKLTATLEKRLLINISSIREAFQKGDIFNIAHISSEYNLADAFTKRMKPALLHKVMTTGSIEHPINQWIIDPE